MPTITAGEEEERMRRGEMAARPPVNDTQIKYGTIFCLLIFRGGIIYYYFLREFRIRLQTTSSLLKDRQTVASSMVITKQSVSQHNYNQSFELFEL